MAAGRPSKTLLERVLENSFRPKRHGDLLGGRPLPDAPPEGFQSADQSHAWALLRDWQHGWKQLRSGRWPSSRVYPLEDRLRQFERDFAELVHWLHGASKPAWLD